MSLSLAGSSLPNGLAATPNGTVPNAYLETKPTVSINIVDLFDTLSSELNIEDHFFVICLTAADVPTWFLHREPLAWALTVVALPPAEAIVLPCRGVLAAKQPPWHITMEATRGEVDVMSSLC